MKQVVDWIEQNAPAIVGGVVLLIAVMAVYAVMARRSKDTKVETDSDDPGIQA
jgi:hypothetical protein